MKPLPGHTTLKGEVISLEGLGEDESNVLGELHVFLKESKDWNAFSNLAIQRIGAFYELRGLTRSEIIKTPLYRVAQDLGRRLALDQGLLQAPAAKPGYREQLSRLIREKYHTRRGFCRDTGISEDLLSHVLAGRKHLAIDTLENALERIGYRIKIVPTGASES